LKKIKEVEMISEEERAKRDLKAEEEYDLFLDLISNQKISEFIGIKLLGQYMALLGAAEVAGRDTAFAHFSKYSESNRKAIRIKDDKLYVQSVGGYFTGAPIITSYPHFKYEENRTNQIKRRLGI
jgi:hypothetical protein